MEDRSVQDHDLAFFTTQELIDELMRRTTFLGVVVHSEKEFTGGPWGEERMFKVRFNSNLETAQASRLLDTVAEFMDRNHC